MRVRSKRKLMKKKVKDERFCLHNSKQDSKLFCKLKEQVCYEFQINSGCICFSTLRMGFERNSFLCVGDLTQK